MEPKFEQLQQRLSEVIDLQAAAAVLGWDQTTYMPPGGTEARGRQMATLARIAHEKFTDDAVGALLRIRDGRVIGREHRFLENVDEVPDGDVRVIQMKDVSPEWGVDWSGVMRTRLAGRKQPDWIVDGDILWNGESIIAMEPDERARAGRGERQHNLLRLVP